MDLAIFLDNLVCRRIQANGDVQYIFRFDNGYGASLVNCNGYRIAPLQFSADYNGTDQVVVGGSNDGLLANPYQDGVNASVDWTTPINPTTSYGSNLILDALQTIANL